MKINRTLRSISAYLFFFLNRSSFSKLGKGSKIYSPLKIMGIGNISIGSNVIIEYKSWLAAIPLTGAIDCVLEIGNGSNLGHFSHIFATKKIVIGKNVLIADKVYISDNLHEYENIKIPIIEQPIRQLNEVIIGDGSWIGENVCIIGASIGKNCVVGANAVITKDIPDYSVAVGAPARIIKTFNLTTGKWEKINE